MLNKRLTFVLAATLLFVGATGCGDDSTDTAATTSTSSTEPATTPEEPVGTSASSDTTATVRETTQAPCTEEAILPVVQTAFEQPTPGIPVVTVASVTIADCRNGYARVYATAEQADMENEQVFLRDVDGTWTVISSGTGIECGDPSNLNETDRAACDALGLTP